MANKAIATFGVVKDWDEDEWRDIGNVAVGLTKGDFDSVRALLRRSTCGCVSA
jgi:hypothetical protein